MGSRFFPGFALISPDRAVSLCIVMRVWTAICVCAALLALPATAGPSGRIDVIDADTFDVGGERVRLHGIDAPELGQPCRTGGRELDCGRWAARVVRDAYQGRRTVCQTIDTDRYGRTVARCSVDGRDIGAALVQAGIATAFRRYSMEYVEIEKQAAAAGRGIWQTDMVDPSAWRGGQPRSTGGAAAPAGCRIKGNISSNGRIYHMPGQEHYDRTRISTSRGERWFCSEAEARSAGWRRARR